MGKKRSDILRGEIYEVKEGKPMPFYKTRKEMAKDNDKMKDKHKTIEEV